MLLNLYNILKYSFKFHIMFKIVNSPLTITCYNYYFLKIFVDNNCNCYNLDKCIKLPFSCQYLIVENYDKIHKFKYIYNK